LNTIDFDIENTNTNTNKQSKKQNTSKLNHSQLTIQDNIDAKIGDVLWDIE